MRVAAGPTIAQVVLLPEFELLALGGGDCGRVWNPTLAGLQPFVRHAAKEEKEPTLTDAAVCTNGGFVFSGPYRVKLPLSFGRDAILTKNALYLILRNV